MISDGVNSYTWDRANRLLSMGGASYQYDGEGRRVQQTVSSIVTKYLLDIQPGLSVVLSETTGANTMRYVHSPRGIHAHKDTGGNWEWTIQDGLGSVREVVDNSVGVLESRNYDPYGNAFGATGTNQTGYGFTGELVDGSGLLDLRARRYSAGMGVFASLDPLETRNRYAYVSGNPINLSDPFGLQDEEEPFDPVKVEEEYEEWLRWAEIARQYTWGFDYSNPASYTYNPNPPPDWQYQTGVATGEVAEVLQSAGYLSQIIVYPIQPGVVAPQLSDDTQVLLLEAVKAINNGVCLKPSIMTRTVENKDTDCLHGKTPEEAAQDYKNRAYQYYNAIATGIKGAVDYDVNSNSNLYFGGDGYKHETVVAVSEILIDFTPFKIPGLNSKICQEVAAINSRREEGWTGATEKRHNIARLIFLSQALSRGALPAAPETSPVSDKGQPGDPAIGHAEYNLYQLIERIPGGLNSFVAMGVSSPPCSYGDRANCTDWMHKYIPTVRVAW